MDKITFNHLDDIRHYVNEIRSARTLNEARDYADHIMGHAEDLMVYLESKPSAGRRRVYDDEKRAEIFAYYNDNSYKDTLSHFGISPDTLNRIIKENQ